MRGTRERGLRVTCVVCAPFLSQLSVGEYLKAMDMGPTDFISRPVLLDPIEADHMHAILQANNKEKSREANAMNVVRDLNLAAHYRAHKE